MENQPHTQKTHKNTKKHVKKRETTDTQQKQKEKHIT